MFVKNLNACHEFTANDGCLIRELLHPKNDPVDPGYSLAVARVRAGERTLQHKLVQAEVYYIISLPDRAACISIMKHVMSVSAM